MAINLDDVVASRKLAKTVCAKMLKDAESQFVVYAGMMLLLMVCKSKPNLEVQAAGYAWDVMPLVP